MNPIGREDMVVVGMGIDTLLECVRQTEIWWRVRGNRRALLRTQQLGSAILATRRKFFAEDTLADDLTTEALIMAEDLREAARQCAEGQAVLHARLIGGAQIIEWLCRSRGARP
jgi:hypothetical protein